MATSPSYSVPFNRPTFLGQKHSDFVKNLLESQSSLASGGNLAQKCDDWLTKFYGTPTLTTSSATHALEMAAILAQVGPGDEVVMPSHSFVTAATAFALRGTTIVFCDCDENGNASLEHIKPCVSPKTKAIVAIHYLGSSSDIEAIAKFCNEKNIVLIEDAAQALGSTFHDRKLGTFGALGCISFHDTKNVTAGQGGALIINDVTLLRSSHFIRDKGTNRREFLEGKVDKYSWIHLGSSYAMAEINAAYLFPQLEQFESIQKRREELWKKYEHALQSQLAPVGNVLQIPEWNQSNWHAFALVFKNENLRNSFISYCKKENVSAHSHFVPLHSSPYGMQNAINSKSDFENTMSLTSRLVRLPLYFNLTDTEQDRVIDVCIKALANLKEQRDVALKKSIVIIGAGFAGLECAKGLGDFEYAHVTLIDKNNYHLFQPLLYQVATAGLSPANIATPVRSILSDYKNIDVMMGTVADINDEKRFVLLEDGHKVFFDILVIATGVSHSYFGHHEWEAFAPGLKSIEDATSIRRQILVAFEKAEIETDSEKKNELLNFVIVGGGPTGVELAGAIAELASRALKSDFRHIDPQKTNIYLIEAGERLLSAFSKESSDQALRDLRKLGVDVLLQSRVTEVKEGVVTLMERTIKAQTIIWAAGVSAKHTQHWLKDIEKDSAGRIKVTHQLSVPNKDHVFVIGDACHFEWKDGKTLPGTAPVAIQQGRYLAQALKNKCNPPRNGTQADENAVKSFENTFKYLDKGNMATIGRNAAVAEVGKLHFKGILAWMMWLTIHIYYLIGFKNRILVLIQWAWAYVRFQAGARLITNEKRNE